MVQQSQDQEQNYGQNYNSFGTNSYYSNSYYAQEQTQQEEPTENTQFNDNTDQEEYTASVPNYGSETEYSSSDMPTDEVDGEYAIVKTFMPNVEKTQIVEPLKIERKTIEKTKLKLNSRGKILVSVYSCVACLLVAFCVINIASLAGANKQLSAKQKEYEQVQTELKNYQNIDAKINNTINNEIEAGLENGSYIDPSVNSTKTVSFELQQRPEYVNPKASTNWFDKICNFLSKLF